MSDGQAINPTDGPARPGERRPAAARPAPNYAARRMLVSTVAITAVAAVAVFGWRAVRGDQVDDGGTTVDWDEIALVDRATGTIVTVDDEGQLLHAVAGAGRVSSVYAHGDRLALVGPTSIVLTGVTDDEPAPTTVAIPPGSIVASIETITTLHLLVGDPAGGNLLIVDVADGSVIDVGAAAAPTVPKMFVETVRVDADGTRFAVADASNFQTIVVREDAEGADFLADQPIAIGDDLIATSQVVNLQADVALVDDTRTAEVVVPMELPRGGLMIDDQLIVVTVDGGVQRLNAGDRAAERIGAVAVPSGGTVSWARPTFLGERLIVTGTTFEAVVDLEGRTLFTTTFTNPVDIDPPRPGWRCLPVGGGDTWHSIVSLLDGEQVADLTGLVVTDVSADGCTVLGERNGLTEIVADGGTARVGQVRSARLAPDGRVVVLTTTTGRTEVVELGDDLQPAAPIELPDAPASLEVAFLDR